MAKKQSIVESLRQLPKSAKSKYTPAQEKRIREVIAELLAMKSRGERLPSGRAVVAMLNQTYKIPVTYYDFNNRITRYGQES